MKNYIKRLRRVIKFKHPLGIIIGAFFIAGSMCIPSGIILDLIFPKFNLLYLWGTWWIIIVVYFLHDEWPNNKKNKLLRAMYLLALNKEKNIDGTLLLDKRNAEKCFKCGRKFVSDENFIGIDYDTTAYIDQGILTYKEILGDVHFLKEYAFDRNSDTRIKKTICIDCINKYFDKKTIFTDGRRIITPKHFF